MRGGNDLGGFPTDVRSSTMERQTGRQLEDDGLWHGSCLFDSFGSKCRGGSPWGTYQLHRHRVLQKFRNDWCDMIIGFYCNKSVSLAPVCLSLPRNTALRIWLWIMYLMYLSLEAAVWQLLCTSVCVLQCYGWHPGPHIWPCFPNIVCLIIVTICW